MCFTHIHTWRYIMGNLTKSGYELRSDILGMAIGIVESRIQRKCENEYLKPEGERQGVNPYTTEDVLEEAEKLLAFVNRK